jgi:hypothetical protein
VLPHRYVRIRHFGLLANRSRKDNIALCRELLGSCKTVTKEKEKPETWQDQLLRICGIDVTTCPVCKKGTILRVDLLLPFRCNGPPDYCWWTSWIAQKSYLHQPAKSAFRFALLSCCLKSPLGMPPATLRRNPTLCFHLRMISCRSKVGRFNPDNIPFNRKNTGRD